MKWWRVEVLKSVEWRDSNMNWTVTTTSLKPRGKMSPDCPIPSPITCLIACLIACLITCLITYLADCLGTRPTTESRRDVSTRTGSGQWNAAEAFIVIQAMVRRIVGLHSCFVICYICCFSSTNCFLWSSQHHVLAYINHQSSNSSYKPALSVVHES